jgi:hypothetical protein
VLLNCNFYVMPPRSSEFLLHQNWPALPLDDMSVTVWGPLLETDVANGTLEFVVGSHKIVPHVEGPNMPGLFDKIRRQVIEKYLTPVPVKASEAIIFDDSLIHWSACNTSQEPRVAIQILCVPADAQPSFYFYDPAHPERFERIKVDTEFFLKTRARTLCSQPRLGRSRLRAQSQCPSGRGRIPRPTGMGPGNAPPHICGRIRARESIGGGAGALRQVNTETAG